MKSNWNWENVLCLLPIKTPRNNLSDVIHHEKMFCLTTFYIMLPSTSLSQTIRQPIITLPDPSTWFPPLYLLLDKTSSFSRKELQETWSPCLICFVLLVLYSLKSSSIQDRVNLSTCLLNPLAMLIALCHLIYCFTGNLISLPDLLLPAGEQLHPGQSEPVPLPTEHPDNAALPIL